MSTAPACSACRFWGNEPYDPLPVGIRKCTKAVQIHEAAEWDEETFERVLKPGLEGQKLFVTDASWYAASIYTTADFFCAHYEAAP